MPRRARWFGAYLLVMFASAWFSRAAAWAPDTRRLQEPASSPKLLHHVAAQWPGDERDAAAKRMALAAIIVARDGTVKAVTPLSGTEVSKAAVVAALQQWRFEPGASMHVLLATVTFGPKDPSPVSMLPIERVRPDFHGLSDVPGDSVVVLSAEVGRDGAVRSVSPLSGPGAMAKPATEALRKWRFRGHPVPFRLTFAVHAGTENRTSAQMCGSCDASCRLATEEACTPGTCQDGVCMCWRFEPLLK